MGVGNLVEKEEKDKWLAAVAAAGGNPIELKRDAHLPIHSRQVPNGKVQSRLMGNLMDENQWLKNIEMKREASLAAKNNPNNVRGGKKKKQKNFGGEKKKKKKKK